MTAISLTYEFPDVHTAIRFVTRGTVLGIMAALRDGAIVHIVTTSGEIQDVNHLAKSLGGMAIG